MYLNIVDKQEPVYLCVCSKEVVLVKVLKQYRISALEITKTVVVNKEKIIRNFVVNRRKNIQNLIIFIEIFENSDLIEVDCLISVVLVGCAGSILY